MIEKWIDNLKTNTIVTRISISLLYGLMIGVALNFFWRPAHIYAGGFNGLAQLLSQLTGGVISVSLMMLIVNLPMLILGVMISRKMVFYSLIAIASGSFFSLVLQPNSMPLTTDPLVAAIFGSLISGFGVGMALRNNVTTGGLDILSIWTYRKFKVRLLIINIVFNALIMLLAALINGWQYAFYSIIGLVVSAWITNLLYTRQQQMQVMIVTNKKDEVIEALQNQLRRGITVLNHVEGGYLHDSKNVLLTVITLEERFDVRRTIKKIDPEAFASIWKVDQVVGKFFEKGY